MVASADARLESEFKREVQLSLERAFAEGHSVDNAAVELKTLRMASNVPLIRVREAVVGGIVDRIKIAEGGAAPQRAEIASVVGRWGDLINQIGGVDAVETVSVLQVNRIWTVLGDAFTDSFFRCTAPLPSECPCSAKYWQRYIKMTS